MNPPVVYAPVFSLEDAPAQISEQYRRALAATREILVFGAMLLEVQNALPRNVFDTRTGQSLKGWLAEHCPEINYNTAKSFLILAKGLVDTLQLEAPARAALPALLSAPAESLPESLAPARAAIDDAISGRSKRQLEFDFGIRAAPKPRGGARPGAGRPARNFLDEIEAAAQDPEVVAAAFREHLEPLQQLVAQNRHFRLGDTALSALLSDLSDMAEAVKQHFLDRMNRPRK